ncbi:MAG: glutathione S-transferase N-terminal domain-containing protein [Pseudomonadota bacterium]
MTLTLFNSPTSPYGRKCQALVIEKGLEGQVDTVLLSPTDDPVGLHEANPLGKVPALTRDSRPALFDSPLICEYLDTLNDERWIPTSGESRFLVLRQQALADGLIDLTVGRRIETTRDVDLRYPYWAERWERGIERGLDLLESERNQFERSVDLGALSVAVALSYLDLRHHGLDWRARCPGLAEFSEKWFARDSFKRTAPPENA